MNQIIRRIRREFGQRRPTDHPDLPNDWEAIHIPFERRELTLEQQKTITTLDRWEPVTKSEPRKSVEELSFEKQKERMKDLTDPAGEMAVHIRREDILNRHTEEDEKWGKRRGEHAQDSISELLDVFPNDQIKIHRNGRDR
ncbi:MAG TPA: hypothetical protein VFJ06_02195 [Halococcus sp.]|nr:hypothetical protein [Halococcus sp.]